MAGTRRDAGMVKGEKMRTNRKQACFTAGLSLQLDKSHLW